MGNLINLSPNWKKEGPASDEAIQSLLESSTHKLPQEYLALLKISNGGEGELGIEPGWLQLWPAEQVIEHNQGYEVQNRVPGFFGFASSGGGELLAFDTRAEQPWKIYMIPFGCMEEENAILIAESLMAFTSAIGQPIDD